MLKNLLVLILLLFSVQVWSLEIDEKLTMRIVKASQSKKTILINRGVEDGLVKGDHAKFFLTVGVVARGVVVKLAPTRSVWSVYRLVNADYLKNGQVMKLKITSPVKITKDDSRSLVLDDTPSNIMSSDPRELGIQLADGADDLSSEDVMMGGRNNNGSKTGVSSTILESSSLREKSKEIFGTVFYSGLGAKAQPGDASGDYSAESSTMLLNLGGEFYSKNEKKWQSRFSIVVQYSMLNSSIMANQGSNVVEKSSEYGGGIHWYPLTRPSKTFKFIPYARFLMLLGSVATTYNPGIEGGNSETLGGASYSYIVGGGAKYYLHNGFGARFEFEYYSRTDSFAADQQNGLKWTTAKSGPRVVFGLSYRW